MYLMRGEQLGCSKPSFSPPGNGKKRGRNPLDAFGQPKGSGLAASYETAENLPAPHRLLLPNFGKGEGGKADFSQPSSRN